MASQVVLDTTATATPNLFGRMTPQSKRLVIGLLVLAVLFIFGVIRIPGFASPSALKSLLVLASFLGIASIGQTLTALVGGLDLSIPFMIGSANILFPYAVAQGIPPLGAMLFVLAVGAILGLINGFIGWYVNVHPLVLTLGTGFALAGAAQVITSIGSDQGGNVQGGVPPWLENLVAVNGTTFGIPIAPVILIWVALSALTVIVLRRTLFGISVYALGDSPVAAERALVRTRRTWVLVFVASGVFAAIAGFLLVGFTGGGFISVGDPYLFTTLVAVVIGGTTLLGGSGGYGLTVVGVLILGVLTNILVGFKLSTGAAQVVLGLVIVLMVTVYAREPHIRNQI